MGWTSCSVGTSASCRLTTTVGPLYVTPEEYQELRAWGAHEQEERERRFGPQWARSPKSGEPVSLQDMFFGTPVVVDWKGTQNGSPAPTSIGPGPTAEP
jgi:hypothetical protein